MSARNGGPAFPGNVDTGMVYYDERTQSNRPMFEPQTGMTLLDYFASTVHTNFDELTAQYAEKIVGRAIPDYASDVMGNAEFWAEFRARMRYVEAAAMVRVRNALESEQ